MLPHKTLYSLFIFENFSVVQIHQTLSNPSHLLVLIFCICVCINLFIKYLFFLVFYFLHFLLVSDDPTNECINLYINPYFNSNNFLIMSLANN